MDPEFGMFGWLSSENFIYCFFVMGIFCRSGTFIAYTYALYSYSIIIVTNAMMLEPLIS
jgi:drug/metabolite transporter (DMT)-like permease